MPTSTQAQPSLQTLQTKKFRRNVESFTCSRCSHNTDGTGYTDHCPNCLWSKHVDHYPGDRAATCKGLMEPVGYSVKEATIHYHCTQCGKYSKVKAAPEDNKDLLMELSTNPILC